MKKKLLKLLISESYIDRDLDSEKVQQIAVLLRRKDLKQYIRALKAKEQKRTVLIKTAKPLSDEQMQKFQAVFSGKNLSVILDPSLKLGIQVINNDDVIDLSLTNTLEKMKNYIVENYD